MNNPWIKRLKAAIALLALLGLTACGGGGGGGGGNATTAPGQIGIQAAFSYNDNVQVPSPEESANIHDNSNGTLTVSGGFSYQVGQIVVVNNKAYKISGVTSSGGNAVLQTTPPAFDEIFSDFILKGTVSLPATGGTQAGLQLNSITDRFQKYADPTQLFELGKCMKASPSKILDSSGTVYVGVKATFDQCVIAGSYLKLDGDVGVSGTIDFDIDLRAGKMNIGPKIRFDPNIFIGFLAAKEGKFIAPIVKFIIPLEESGIPIEVTVPIDIILSGKISVADGIGLDGKIISSLSLKKNSATDNFSFVPTFDASDLKVIMPLIQGNSEIAAQIRFGVGISALTVNMVTFDPRIGLLGEGKLQLAVKATDGTVTCGGVDVKGVGGADVVLAQGTWAEKAFQLISVESDPFWEAPWNCVSPTPAPITTTAHLNDTGITASQCYQAGSDTLVACSSAGALALNNAQDGMTGRDVTTSSGTDGKLGFSFTAVTGGCVLDNVTGLMWEVKTNNGGLRDWSKTYTNYSVDYNPSNLYGTVMDASGFVTAVNATNLCGYNDWRLPAADELQSIVDYGVTGPAVDATWFPNTQSGWFWSVSPGYGRLEIAWGVLFHVGNFSGYFGRTGGLYVRLVRAGQAQTSLRYIVSADGQEVTDSQTNLIWRRCAEGMVASGGSCTGIASTFTYEAALQRAATQASSAGKAWRLPNIKELSSIADKSSISPAIDPTAFPATTAAWFWSASPFVGDSYAAWYVDFSDGVGGGYNRIGAIHVRLLRAGQ